MTEQTADPTALAEAALGEIKRRNIEAKIAPREVELIDKLLHRTLELRGVYAEVHGKLRGDWRALALFLQLILDGALEWNPAKLAEARRSRNALSELNAAIAEGAHALSTLVRDREELMNSSSFTSRTHFHVCDAIEAAASDNYYFQSHVRDELDAVRIRYDLKYWPSISEFLYVLATDASSAEAVAYDGATAVGTSGERASKAHFFYALYQIIGNNSQRAMSQLPTDFSLTDASWASLVNCLLGAGPDDLVDAGWVKGARHRLSASRRAG